MGRLYFMADGDEMVRRRARVPKGSVVEAWADRRGGAAFWVGEDSRRLLDEAGERPMAPPLSLPHRPPAPFFCPPPFHLAAPARVGAFRPRALCVYGLAPAR